MNYFFLIFLYFSLTLGIPFSAREDAILFCLKHSYDKLEINNRGREVVGNISLNKILTAYNVQSIEPWIPHAREGENSGDIYLNRIYRINIAPDRKLIQLLKADIESLPEVHSAEYEFIRKPNFTPNDSQYNQQWFLPQINANDAWEFWSNSGLDFPGDKSVLLASVDTGVDWDHPDLRNNIWNNLGEDADGDGQTIIQSGNSWIFDPGDVNAIDDDGNGYIDDFIGWDCSSVSGGEDNNPMPPSGVSNGGTWAHGTHVAGLLGATTNNNTGIASTAFDASIMCVKVSTDEQSYPYITHGYNGILYAAQAGHDAGNYTIINNSWGGTGYSQYEQTIIDVAYYDYGAIILAAGGNGDDENFQSNEYAHFPSSYDNVVSVCPLGSGDSWNNWATYHSTIDIASPGEGIRSTRIGSGYTSWSGSSMACPIVASTMGLLKSLNPTWTNEQIETMVIQTSDPIIYSVNPSNSLDGKLGRGRVDALAALGTPLFPKIEFIDIDLFIQNDNNNIIEQGEAIELLTILGNNEDWGFADNVSGVLELSDGDNDNISILQNTASFGDANPGDALINFSPFIIEFGDNSPIGEIEFNLNISSNVDGYIQNNQVLHFSINVSEESILIGDMNQDNVLDILDIVQLINIVLDNNPTDLQLSYGDINEDQIINVLDIILIVNLILS